jgi:hypothetical protein
MALPRRSTGMPLPDAERTRFEAALSANLSDVRVHTGAEAERSADALDARAFAIGGDIHFGASQYAPDSPGGLHLLAHEVAHTVQQRPRAGDGDLALTHAEDAHERGADRFADAFLAGIGRTAWIAPGSAPAAIARAPKAAAPPPLPTPATAIRKGAAIGGGKITFYPRSVSATRLGNVPQGTGGPSGDWMTRLDVIVDQGTTITLLATLLLPLWNDAGPSQPDTSAGEIDVPPLALTVETLARGLFGYNQQLLGPAMANWKPGLRFPLPIRINQTGEALVQPQLIADLAGGFPADQASLLTQPIGAAEASDPADVKARATAFLAERTDATARGFGLGARALTNARAERPFVVEALHQLAGTAALDVALWFLDWVNAKVAVLSSQPDGVAILDAIRAIVAAASPDQLAARKNLADRAGPLLEQGRAVEVALTTRDWPTALPHAGRGAGQHITKKKGSAELNMPAMPAAKLSDTNQRIVAAIQQARDQLPAPDPKIASHSYGGDSQAGHMYTGSDNKNKPSTATSKDPKRAAIMTEIDKEIGREGGWSAVNTYDDAIVTLGAGFTRSMLAQVMQKFFTADPGAEERFLDVGVTWSGGKALVVNTATGAVEEGDDALQVLRANLKIIGLFVTMAEGPEHGQKLADAQHNVVLGTAGDVPQSVVDSWTDMMSVRLVAHLIQWRSSKPWSAYAGTGGDVKAILRVLIPAAVGKEDPARGHATFLTKEQTGILRSFAGGKAGTAMTGPAALPADIKTGSYSGHIYFEADGGFFELAP